MEIACINCYEGECYDNANPVSDGSGDGAVTTVPSHIDIISKQLYNTGHAWNSSGYNSSSSNYCPWLGSDLYDYLQNTVYPLLPQQLQDVVIEKCMKIEQREYEASSPYGECWQPIGKLWIPNELELFGTITYSNTTYGAYGSQYEVFDTVAKRSRTRNGYSAWWWTLSPNSSYSNRIVSVGVFGDIASDSRGTSSNGPFLLCCRLYLK